MRYVCQRSLDHHLALKAELAAEIDARQPKHPRLSKIYFFLSLKRTSNVSDSIRTRFSYEYIPCTGTNSELLNFGVYQAASAVL